MRRILYAMDLVFMSDAPIPSSLLSSSIPSQSFADEKVAFSAEGPHHPAAITILRPFYELM